VIDEDEKIHGGELDRWHTWHTQVKWEMHLKILSKPCGRTVMPMHRWDLDQ
jgi:hypothetical protein